jgi:hypothetical protein
VRARLRERISNAREREQDLGKLDLAGVKQNKA